MFRLSGLRLVVLGAVALTVGVGMPPPGELSACRKASPWGPLILAQSVYFLGVGTSDSIAAPVDPGLMPRGYLSPDSAEGLGVRGQVVDVIELLRRGDGGPGDLLSGHDQAIVVWWDYGPSCQPILWRASILHAEPGIENLFEGTLLAPEHWVEGTPVIHAHRPFHGPFPGIEHRRVQRAVEAGRPVEEVERDHLSAREFFDFLSRISSDATRDELDDRIPAPIHTAILEWARVHPERWNAYPVATMVRDARNRVHAVAPVEDHPAAGTYRIDVQVGDEAGEICVRMVPSFFDALPADYEEYAPPLWEDRIPAVEALRIEAAEACDAPAGEWGEFPPVSSYTRKARIWIHRTAEEGTAPGELRVWRGALSPGGFSEALRGTGVIEQDLSHQSVLWSAVPRDEPTTLEVRRAGTLALTTARFVLHDDGRMTVSDDRGEGRYQFRVSGERVGGWDR
jgi:hypothetical protein